MAMSQKLEVLKGVGTDDYDSIEGCDTDNLGVTSSCITETRDTTVVCQRLMGDTPRQ